MDTIRTWSDLGLVPGFSIIRPERQLYVTHLEPSTSFFSQFLMQGLVTVFNCFIMRQQRIATGTRPLAVKGKPHRLKEKTPRIEEKSSFRLNCLALGSAKQYIRFVTPYGRFAFITSETFATNKTGMNPQPHNC